MIFPLEVRKCKCGCTLTFKVPPSSKIEYAMKSHAPNKETYPFGLQNSQFWKERKMKMSMTSKDDTEWLRECKKADLEIDKQMISEKHDELAVRQPQARRYAPETRNALDELAKEIYSKDPSTKAETYVEILSNAGFTRPDGTELEVPDIYVLKTRLGLRRRSSKRSEDVNTPPPTIGEAWDNIVGSTREELEAIRNILASKMSDDKKLRMIEILAEEE